MLEENSGGVLALDIEIGAVGAFWVCPAGGAMPHRIRKMGPACPQ
jgi:hypothetical protein